VQVAVVTGGSSGIGAATARLLAARGWHCVLIARGAERLEAVAAEIGAEAEVCDVSQRTQVDELAARIAKRHPAVGLLVNNAGFTGRRGFLELEPEETEQIVDTVYLGSVWSVRAWQARSRTEPRGRTRLQSTRSSRSPAASAPSSPAAASACTR
jgi:NADP-dependent 3-hydroxy acid dehydrogenase YdfG